MCSVQLNGLRQTTTTMCPCSHHGLDAIAERQRGWALFVHVRDLGCSQQQVQAPLELILACSILVEDGRGPCARTQRCQLFARQSASAGWTRGTEQASMSELDVLDASAGQCCSDWNSIPSSCHQGHQPKLNQPHPSPHPPQHEQAFSSLSLHSQPHPRSAQCLFTPTKNTTPPPQLDPFCNLQQ